MRFYELLEVDAIDNDAMPGSTDSPLKKGPPYPEEQTEAVAKLQGELKRLGYSLGSTGIDGKFGHRTAAALRSARKDHGMNGSPTEITKQEISALSTKKPIKAPTPTGNERGGGDTVSFASGEGEGRVRMGIQGKTRNQPIQRALMDILKTAAEAAGVDVLVTSGGQDELGKGSRRTGSTRHDGGYAADIQLSSEGKVLRTDRENPIVAKFIAAAVDAGARGIGAGAGYMNSTGIHVDLWGASKGANLWGKGGRTTNTPDYVRMAYRTGQSGKGLA